MRIKKRPSRKRKLYKMLAGQQVDTTGMVAWWKLDNSAFDYTLNGNNGTITGAVPAYPGYSFDGTDDVVNCGSDSTIDDIFVGGGTAVCWLLSNGLGESNLGRAIGKNCWEIAMVTDTTTMRFRQLFTGDDGIWTFPITASVWQQVAVVYDNDAGANNPVVYVNAASVTVTETTTPGSDTDTADSASVFYIGDSAGSTVCWNGKIGDVMLYDSTRTAQQIKSLFDQTRSKYSV